jgi:hypothetical protein
MGILDGTGCKCVGGIYLLNDLKVKTWAGEEKQVKKIVFFPEKDESGEVFYKIEGWNNESYFMIDYSYNREIVWTKYIELLQRLVEFQAKE